MPRTRSAIIHRIHHGWMPSQPPDNWQPNPTFGDRLRVLRKAYGLCTGQPLTMAAFAKMLGIPAGTYQNYEAGNAEPRDMAQFVQRVFEVTRCDPAWLAGGAMDGALSTIWYRALRALNSQFVVAA